MKILAIDPGTIKCGLCYYDSEKEIFKHKLFDLTKEKLKPIVRIQEMAKRVSRYIKKKQSDILIIEDYAYGSQARSVTALAEFRGSLYCYLKKSFDLEKIIIVAIGTWKKGALGKGNIKKDMILKEALRKYKKNFDDDNLCDAYCMVQWYLKEKKL